MASSKKLLDFYINSSIHVALAVVGFCLVTYWKFDTSSNPVLLAFVFFGTITGYNFVKYAKTAKSHHRSLSKGLKAIQIFSLVSFLIMVWLSLMLPPEMLLWIGLFGTLTLLYALPVFSKKRNLRSIAGLKILIISTVWAGVTVLLPLIPTSLIFEPAVVIEFLQRFILTLVLILPFEIRDLNYDLKQLATIPQKLGVAKTKIFGLVLLLVILGLEILKNASFYLPLDLVMICAIAGISILFAKQDQPEYYASFWVEAVPVFWVVILLVIRTI